MLAVACAGDPNSEVGGPEYAAGDNWPYYHGNPAGTHYSRLKEINTDNVHRLEVAWIYDTQDPLGNTTIESNPLVIDGKLFLISPIGRLICLDGATGRELWSFDPGAGQPLNQRRQLWRRGLSYWSDGKERRIFFTFGNDLYAADADNGRSVKAFGSGGHVPLGTYSSSPGVVYQDLIIMGGSASKIRAFDVRTGELRWTFHTIPRPGEFGYETWPKDAWKNASGANNWGGMSLDEARGIVFVPLAFPQNFHGAKRVGDNLFANCLVALDARSGRRLWHFQTIRHDIWDLDLPAAPTLIRVVRDGKLVDAVAQVSKVGFVYVLDRLTGESLFPLRERETFPSDIPGEVVARTQPEPVMPVPFARQHVTADQLTRRTPEAAKAVAEQFAELRSRGLWDPPSEQGTLLVPSVEGGASWGGAAYDPESHLLYVNSNELPSILKLKRRSDEATSGASVYRDYCAGCHGANREGMPPELPSLLNIADRMTFSQIITKVATGSGRMPGFSALATDYGKIWPLVEYLQTGVDAPVKSSSESGASGSSEEGAEYVLASAPKFVDPDGYPAVSPPWGTLNAIDLNTGEYAWKIPFGEYPELAAQGLKDTGSPNYGGPIVTAGGLLFIGATSFDKKFRAYDKRTGKLLWEAELPAAGIATPSTYRVNGRQFVVIPAGGGRPPTSETGSKIVAFALPN